MRSTYLKFRFGDVASGDYLDIEQSMLKTREKYGRRFGKVIAMTKVLRFFQIDNELDLVSRLALAREIPLAK